MAVRKILLVNGPNLDMLGVREPDVYGRDTLATLEHTVRMHTEQRGAELKCFQSNNEGKLIDKIHGAIGKYDGIVYNPGAHTHYSYALRDAVAGIDVPVVEVHLSDVNAREPFRRISVIAPACVARVKGLGVSGYCRAVDVLLDYENLPRLGEGFEERFPADQAVIIAGQKAGSTPSGATLSGFRPERIEGSSHDGGPDEPLSPDSAIAPEVTTEPNASHNLRALDEGGTSPFGLSRAEAPEDLTAAFAEEAAVDMGALSARRIERIREACGHQNLAAFLVRDTSNIRWLSGYDGVFDTERAHALVVGPKRCALHTDSRYSNAMRTIAASIGSAIAIDDSRKGHFAFALDELASQTEAQAAEEAASANASTGDSGSLEASAETPATTVGVRAQDAVEPDAVARFEGKLGIEDTITLVEYNKATETFGAESLVPTSDVVLSLRAVKDHSEIARMRAAQAITDAAFEHIVQFMRPGMTEREVQLELEDFMLRHGADGLAFGSIVACGENGADPHALPGKKRLEAGQCVVMDFGARAFGYCSDMTRMVFLGAPQGEMARAWDVLRRANETVEQMLRPGVTGREAHELAERVLADGGFGGRMGHGLGHGVGLDCHELPVLNPRNETALVEGNVVTVEPGIYLPGEFGMRLEDCGVITASGYEVFSGIGHETVIV